MKRTATILGVAVALAVPSVASAGNVTAQVKLQVKPQVKTQVMPQVVTAQRVDAAVTAQRVTSMQAKVHRISITRLAR
jgi:hypothetical protein